MDILIHRSTRSTTSDTPEPRGDAPAQLLQQAGKLSLNQRVGCKQGKTSCWANELQVAALACYSTSHATKLTKHVCHFWKGKLRNWCLAGVRPSSKSHQNLGNCKHSCHKLSTVQASESFHTRTPTDEERVQLQQDPLLHDGRRMSHQP